MMGDKTDDYYIYLARCLRLAVIQSQYRDGNLTEAQARKLLSGRLKLDDPSSVFDDSGRLMIKSLSGKKAEREFDKIIKEFRSSVK